MGRLQVHSTTDKGEEEEGERKGEEKRSEKRTRNEH